MRGRKPRPPELKLLSGERADRINPDAPARIAERPAAPPHLDAAARAKWDELVEVLDKSGVLSKGDASALALYCAAHSRYLTALVKLAEDPVEVMGNGGVKPSPFLSLLTQAEATMLRILPEFGLTPSSRNRVSGQAEGPKDELTAFIERRKTS